MSFLDWLIKEKGYGLRSAKDVESRLRRIRSLVGPQLPTNNQLGFLESKETFRSLSTSVKSQMRRAIKLEMEYSDYFSHLTQK